MAITDWPASERPREKLLESGPGALSDAELLAIFLRTGVKGKSAVDLARELLTDFGGLRPLLTASQADFCQPLGLGAAKFAQLQAVLEMARAGEDLLAVASFHGLLETALPAAKPITPRILVCHGDADAMLPRKQVIGFWEEMDAVNADWHFHSYAGVEHGFTMSHRPDGSANPAHDASAERQSWAAMHSLFDEVLA